MVSQWPFSSSCVVLALALLRLVIAGGRLICASTLNSATVSRVHVKLPVDERHERPPEKDLVALDGAAGNLASLRNRNSKYSMAKERVRAGDSFGHVECGRAVGDVVRRERGARGVRNRFLH